MTISVPVSSEMERQIKSLIDQGVATNKASLIRTAIEKYLEDQAVNAVLQAEKEPVLRGDLDELMKKI